MPAARQEAPGVACLLNFKLPPQGAGVNLLDPLYAVVLTYRDAGVNTIAAVSRDVASHVETLGRETPVFVLHTCGRVETYFYGAPRGVTDAVVDVYRKHSNRFYTLQGVNAARHLLRVAAGLDSVLVGETDVLGQLEEAFDKQVRSGCTRGVLKLIVERAVITGKRVRSETRIAQGPRGLGSLSVMHVSQFVDLSRARVAVIGAGSMGASLAMELAARGVSKLYILNRTLEKAVRLAERVGAEARPLTRGEVERCLMECDVVFSAVHAQEYVIDRIPEGASVRVIVDLGVPYTVAPGLPVAVVRIDDLRELAERFNAERAPEIAKAEAIIEEELARLSRLIARKYIEEAIAAALEKAMSIAEEEGARARCDVAALAAKSTAKRILLPLVEELKRMAENGQLNDALAIARLITQKLLSREAPGQ